MVGLVINFLNLVQTDYKTSRECYSTAASMKGSHFEVIMHIWDWEVG